MEKRSAEDEQVEHYPAKLEISHSNLSLLFCHAGIGIDNYLLGRMKDNEYRAVIRTGKILYQYALSAKAGSKSQSEGAGLFEDMFLFKILRELGQEPKTLEEIANPVMQIGLDFIKMKELPRKRQEELRALSLLLSRRARSSQYELNPHGFRGYAA